MRNTVLGGRYRILEMIGEGGMAYVYLALDEKLGRKVAIKVLHQHMEKNADIRQRFQLEAQAISGLDHPNIVKIYDFSGNNSERLWIVQEVINGKNLAEFVAKFTGGWIHPVVAACIVRESCKALEKAHSQGIVHRDIKPENIMLTNHGVLKLMDFGIAKDMGNTRMTVTGTFMGSPSYMSPEQIRGREVDHRSDLYSLSVMFYVVTGRLPYTGQTTHDVVMRIMEGSYTHPRFIVPDIPPALDKIIVRGMSKEKDSRYQSAVNYGRELDQVIATLGFHESHFELERYFRDSSAYEAKLASKSSPRLTKAVTQPQTPSEVKRPTRVPRVLKPQTEIEPARPSSPPFRQADTWQAHMAPAQPTMKKSVEIPPPPRRTQFNQTKMPSAEPKRRRPAARRQVRAPRRRAVRRVQQVSRYQSKPSFLSFALGFVMVGVIGCLAIWGFWQFQQRIDKKQSVIAEDIHQSTTKSKYTKGKTPKKITKRYTKRTKVPKRKFTKRPPTRKGSKSVYRKPTKSKKRWISMVSKPRKKESQSNPKIEVETAEIIKVTPKRQKPRRKPAPKKPRKPVKVVKAKPIEVEEASKEPGEVRISSQPAAEIYVDGARKGTTVDKVSSSAWISLAPGSHVLELKRQGYALHRHNFTLKGGEQKIFPEVVLEQNSGLNRQYRLTLRSNSVPVQVTIRNIDTNNTQAFTMSSSTQEVTLENGRYQVKLEKEGDVKERFISLTAEQSKLTFSASFKE